MKIQRAIQESENILEARKQTILQKQSKSERQLEVQRQKQKQDDLIKQELYQIKNELKIKNANRKKRKDQYKIDRVKERLEFDEMRKNAFCQQKEDFKDLRLRNQFESLKQRELIRTALHHMALWNVWDVGVVKSIITDKSAVLNNTVGEIIRKKSCEVSRTKRNSSIRFTGTYISFINIRC